MLGLEQAHTARGLFSKFQQAKFGIPAISLTFVITDFVEWSPEKNIPLQPSARLENVGRKKKQRVHFDSVIPNPRFLSGIGYSPITRQIVPRIRSGGYKV